MQLKLKNNLGNNLDVLNITFSGNDFQHICKFIRIFLNSAIEYTRIRLKNYFVCYCNLKHINVTIL